MRKLLALLIALAAIVAGTLACEALTTRDFIVMFPPRPAGAAAYQGPGDLSIGTFSTFWSCRAFSLAKAGTKAYQLKRASDSTTQDINSLGSGLCDTTSPATFCNATT